MRKKREENQIICIGYKKEDSGTNLGKSWLKILMLQKMTLSIILKLTSQYLIQSNQNTFLFNLPQNYSNAHTRLITIHNKIYFLLTLGIWV